MSTSTLKPVEPEATTDQVFAFAVRFATEVRSWHLPGSVVQAAKDQTDHLVWDAIKNVLIPKPEIVEVTEKFIPRIEVLSERPKPCAKRSADDQVADFREMYRGLRWTWTESGLIIPQYQGGFDRLLVFADPTLTNNKEFDVCQASFPSWRYKEDLNSAVPADKDQRHSSRGPYAIWVRDSEDLDRDLIGLSADTILERGLKTLTLLERQLYELVYFRETGQHLDKRTWTLCSGSRDSGGDVPYAGWGYDEFEVRWYNPGCGSPLVGARQAVSL